MIEAKQTESRLAKLRASTLARGGVILLAATACLNLSNFAFHAIIGRFLGPVGYGELIPLISVIGVLTLPLGAIEAMAAQASARHDGPLDLRTCAPILRTSSALGALGSLVWIAAEPGVSRILHTRSVFPILAVALWVNLATPGVVLQGALIGKQRYKVVALSQIIGNGFTRLVVGVALVICGLGITGAMLGTIASALVSDLILLVPFRRAEAPMVEAILFKGKDAFRSVLTLSGVTVLTSIDAWLAKTFLSPTSAGLFNAAATAGKIAMFVPGTVTLVTFPKLAAVNGSGLVAKKILAQALGWIGLSGITVTVVLVIGRQTAIQALFGNGFIRSSVTLPILAVAYSVSAMVMMLTYFFLARQSRAAYLPWVSVTVAIISVYRYHGSSGVVAWNMLAVLLGTLVALAVPAFWLLSRDQRATVVS